MSALGDYIHLNWKNYQMHGVSRKNNLSALDFDKVHKSVRTEIGQYKHKEIKGIQDNYNNKTKEIFSQLTDSSGKLSQNLWAAIIKTANLDNIFNIEDPKTIEYLNSILQLDGNSLNLKLQAGKTFHQIELDMNKLRKRKGSYALFSALKRRLGNGEIIPGKELTGLTAALNKAINDPNIDSAIKARLETDGKKQLKYIKVAMEALENNDRKNETLLKLLKQYTRKDEALPTNISKTGGKIDPQVATLLVRALNELQRLIEGSSYLSSLQAAFSEVLGTIVGLKIWETGGMALVDILKDLAKNGTLGTQKINTTRSSTIALNFEGLKNCADELKNDFELNDKQFLSHFDFWLNEKNEDRVSLVLDYSQPQKADFKMHLSATEKNPVGVSMKNINLNPFSSAPEAHELKFQDSSLIFYLIGMQQNGRDLGNHMLNVLAEHSEKNDDLKNYQDKRDQANRLLALWILYSAMTGRGQGADKQMFADVLIIQEKNSQNIYLFDMASLILELDKGNDLLDMPGLNKIPNISLTNKKLINTTDSNSTEYVIHARLTRILAESRLIKIKAAIPHATLMKNAAAAT